MTAHEAIQENAMAIQIDPGSGQATITFTLAGTDADAVSVVGSFNDWTPGQHTLEPTPAGTLAASVRVAAGHDVHFRYLDSNGTWFDDPDSDAVTEHGSLITAERLVVHAPASVPAPDASAAAPSKARRAKKPSA
jgi:1,4-alpha-glucan branching enzyme